MSLIKVRKGGAAVMKRRLLECCVLVPAGALLLGVGITQYTAHALHYDPALGPPVIGSIYWPWRWWQWNNAGWDQIDQKTFAIGRLVLWGSVTMISLAALSLVRRKPSEHANIHGTARYATRQEVEKGNLFPPPEESRALYLGGWRHKDGSLDYIRHRGAEHIAAVAPMRSGKSHGLCTPNLVTVGGSLVVYDPKGELWDLTAGWRMAEGNSIVLRFELGAIDNTVRYNFFDDIRVGTEFEYGDVASLMEAVADPDGKGLEGHWDPTAATLLIGVALHVIYTKRAAKQTPCLPDVLKALSNPDQTNEDLLKEMRDNRHRRGRRHDEVASVGAEMLGKETKERSSVISTATRMLRTLRDPVLARNVSESDFGLMDLMNHSKPVSLYVICREEHRRSHRPLIRLFFDRMMSRLISVPLTNEGKTPHRWPLLALMDEFASLGKMENFVSAMERCPGYGIRVFLIVQDREQILKEYGQNETVFAMCHIRVVYTPNELRTAEWVSKSLGQETLNKEDVSESGGGGKNSTSRSIHQVGRSLLNPDEVLRLKTAEKDGELVVAPGESLILVSGMFPIKASQSFYFFDDELNRRVRFPKVRTQAITSPKLAGGAP